MSSLNCPSRLCCMAVTAVSLGLFSLSEGHLHACPHTRGKYCVVDLPVCCQCSVSSFLQCLFISKKKRCSGKSVECWTFTDNPFHALCNHVYRYIVYHLFSHLCLYILQVVPWRAILLTAKLWQDREKLAIKTCHLHGKVIQDGVSHVASSFV